MKRFRYKSQFSKLVVQISIVPYRRVLFKHGRYSTNSLTEKRYLDGLEAHCRESGKTLMFERI